MKRTSSVLAASVLVLAVGCAGRTRAPRQGEAAPPRVGVVEFSLTDAEKVVYDGSSDGFGLAVAEAIAADLRERGYQAEAFPRAGTPQGDVIVRGRIRRLDEGSRALRYMVSFGAGAAALAVDGEVVRSDGSQVGAFADERRSGFGIFGGSGEDLLQRNVHEIAEDVGEMIATGNYEMHH